MKVFLKILNVLGAIFASVLMPILLIVLLACPALNALVSVTVPENLSDMIAEIDFSAVLSSDEIESSLEDAGISADAIEDILESEAAQEFIKFYVEDVTELLSGERKESRFTSERVLKIVNEHMDEIVDIVKDNFPDAGNDTDSEIASEIRKVITEDFDQLTAQLPDVSEIALSLESELGVDMDEINEVISFVRSMLMPLMYGVVVVLSALIFLCRAFRFKGMLWLGIGYTFASVLLFVSSIGVDGAVETLPRLFDANIDLTPFSSVFSSMINPFAITYVVIGLLLIGGFIAIRILFKKKTPRAADTAAEYAYAPYQNAGGTPRSSYTPSQQSYTPAYTRSYTPADPAPQAPAAEAPVAEAPVAEAPVAEAPVAEAPAAEAPVAEVSVAEAPESETPDGNGTSGQ